MNKKLRIYLKLSFWIIFAAAILLPKNLDIPLLYVIAALVWILALDSIFLMIQFARGKSAKEYTEKQTRLLCKASFLNGCVWVMQRKAESPDIPPTSEELDQVCDEFWESHKKGSGKESKDEDQELTVSIEVIHHPGDDNMTNPDYYKN